MPSWAAGQRITAAKLNPDYARYARNAGTQSVAAGADTQIQFPTLTSGGSPFITPGSTLGIGQPFNFWRFAAGSGVWHADASIRVSTPHSTWQITAAIGATAWAAGNIKKVGAYGDLNGFVAVTIDASVSEQIVTFSCWQNGGAYTISGSFGLATSVDFHKVG
ncbi:hypothetical protein [Amycolatopsis thermoflava]|uniref:hypothetical protein n=1 Tax=Amycolatopsis thermoflava TaxID=84480 RepID=UPI0038308EA0